MALLSNKFSKNLLVNFFEIKILRNFGKFSFGIYLFHPSAIYLVSILEPYFRIINFRNFFTILSILFSYFGGFLFYHLIEKHLVYFANYLCLKLECIY